MTELSLGGGRKETALRSLLSTHPLRSFLSESCDFKEIRSKISRGSLRGVGISALDYESISTTTFFRELMRFQLGKEVCITAKKYF